MSSLLFQPITLAGMTLANRIAVAPMCQYSAIEGSATDWHLMLLGQLSISGSALVFIEATAVEEKGRITPGCLGLYSDDNQIALEKVINFITNLPKRLTDCDFKEKQKIIGSILSITTITLTIVLT
mgnify:CR=1 FL=1